MMRVESCMSTAATLEFADDRCLYRTNAIGQLRPTKPQLNRHKGSLSV
jgi:hypothetical protein